jgi:hypothetical protein
MTVLAGTSVQSGGGAAQTHTGTPPEEQVRGRESEDIGTTLYSPVSYILPQWSPLRLPERLGSVARMPGMRTIAAVQKLQVALGILDKHARALSI